jgi:hypothetical protein
MAIKIINAPMPISALPSFLSLFERHWPRSHPTENTSLWALRSTPTTINRNTKQHKKLLVSKEGFYLEKTMYVEKNKKKR